VWSSRRSLPVALAIAALSLLPARASADGERAIELVIGQQTVVSAEGVSKYSEGTPGIIDVRLTEDGKQFVLVAQRRGDTSLLLLMKDGREQRYTIVVRADSVQARDNIRLDFYFVQLSSSGATQVGVGWPGTVGGVVTLSASRDLVERQNLATASITSQVLPRLDLAQHAGWAKIRRHATVIMANGEEGQFLSGNEVNFRAINSVSTSIQSIKFGSDVRVRPAFDSRTGRLDLRVVADISEPGDPGPDGLPDRRFSRLETLVNLEPGQAVLLAGLDARSESHASSGLPLLSQVPVLGYLFGSKTRRSEHTENLVFIVPTVIEATERGDADRIHEALELYRSYDGGSARMFELAAPSVRVRKGSRR
jgi:Flp pilus assembly secretin CpaC